ncbi:TetR/AcrR family transcriptional regulator [Halomonas sp. FeN2]|uniref:TetR/AcrR family transcriptional regulator n=1 Tax=Halomonas sp. FeN2 TaxID=2832500 RepID=UPI000C45AF03|nr:MULTISPECIES: TetR/AcrR family transcriptional regulator [unclassified Halomonas]MBF59689.1 TetR family transcriptional regulator [Halomonas sp.]UBR48821.1 TetR/AcrR family transcriptional regulator [Halomonas sp. FeN2]|tara:strand:+ start:2418 stop:3014 length:597 start_codon:yes stop_codon:yes gene_type:complete
MTMDPLPASRPRERIIETASRLFFRQGYCSTGINQIISESGVAKASFYSHFPSKETLAIAWLKQREEVWIRQLKERIAQHASADRRIAAMYSMWYDQIREEGYRGCGFINMAGEFSNEESPIRAVVRDHKNRVRQLIANYVLNEYRAVMKPSEFEELVTVIYSLFDGAIIQAQNFMQDWPIEAALKASIKMLAQYRAL